MAYNGFLFKVGNYIIPADKYIKIQTYKTTLNVQDLDSFRDADGVLHRTALNHRVNKVEFETPSMLTNVEMTELFDKIAGNYIRSAERKCICTIYVPELNDYMSQQMYMSDPTFNIYRILNNIVVYNSVRIVFTAY